MKFDWITLGELLEEDLLVLVLLLGGVFEISDIVLGGKLCFLFLFFVFFFVLLGERFTAPLESNALQSLQILRALSGPLRKSFFF